MLDPFCGAQRAHEEGVIAKRAAGLYCPGMRTREWLKFKAAQSTATICRPWWRTQVHIQVGTFIRVLTVDNIRSRLGDEGNRAAGDSVAADAGPAALTSAKWRSAILASGLAATTPMTLLGPILPVRGSGAAGQLSLMPTSTLPPLKSCEPLGLAQP